MIRVLLVDDQELVRAGLRGILRPQFGFEIAGELPDGSRGTGGRCGAAPGSFTEIRPEPIRNGGVFHTAPDGRYRDSQGPGSLRRAVVQG